MLVVTLVAGAAAFGWINGQAASSEGAYGQSVANNVNFLNERFVVLTESFSGIGVGGSCSGGTSPNFQCTGSSFWIYNTGQVGFTLYSICIKNLTNIPSAAANPNPLNILFYTAKTIACSSGSQTCGFIAYNKAGTTTVCSNTAAFSIVTNQPGIYQVISGTAQPPQILSQSQLSSNPYQIAMPTALTCTAGAMYLYDGLAYTFTFTGLYGNTFTTTVTVNG